MMHFLNKTSVGLREGFEIQYNPGFSRKITVSHRLSWNKLFQREGNHKVDILLPRLSLYTKFS